MMNAAAGIFLAARRKPKLPYDAEVEYLESTGTQYIDLGVKLSNPSIEIVAEARGVNSSNVGLFSAGDSAPQLEIYNWGSRLEVYCGYFSTTALSLGIGNQISVSAAAGAISIVNISTGSKIDRSYRFMGTTSHTAALFCLHRSATSYTYRGLWRLFKADINNFKLIPVRFTNEQGQSEGAMYDRANPTVGMDPDGSPRTDGLYRNRGTGAFTWAEKSA